MTWTNATRKASIDRGTSFGLYRLSWWPRDPLRSPNMSVRHDVNIAAAIRFAKRHDIPSFLDAIK